jgi:hypothetical protein
MGAGGVIGGVVGECVSRGEGGCVVKGEGETRGESWTEETGRREETLARAAASGNGTKGGILCAGSVGIAGGCEGASGLWWASKGC